MSQVLLQHLHQQQPLQPRLAHYIPQTLPARLPQQIYQPHAAQQPQGPTPSQPYQGFEGLRLNLSSSVNYSLTDSMASPSLGSTLSGTNSMRAPVTTTAVFEQRSPVNTTAVLEQPAPQVKNQVRQPAMSSEEMEIMMGRYYSDEVTSRILKQLGRPPDEISDKLQVVALGSSCGVKLSIRRLNLDEATMPFDWIRTSARGIADWLQTDFTNFFRSPFCRLDLVFRDLPMTVYRCATHSFWHDNIEDLATREKLWRRVQRFMGLHTDTRHTNTPRQLLFVRNAAGTNEIGETEVLYELLQKLFGVNGRQVWLLLIIDDQPIVGPILHSKYDRLLFWVQPVAVGPLATTGDAPAPYEEAITFAVRRIFQDPHGLWPGGQPGVGVWPTVPSAADLFAPGSELQERGVRHTEAGMWCGMVVLEGATVETQFCAFEGYREREVPVGSVARI